MKRDADELQAVMEIDGGIATINNNDTPTKKLKAPPFPVVPGETRCMLLLIVNYVILISNNKMHYEKNFIA